MNYNNFICVPYSVKLFKIVTFNETRVFIVIK